MPTKNMMSGKGGMSKKKLRAFNIVAGMIAELRDAIGEEITDRELAEMRTKAYAMPEGEREAFFRSEYERVFGRTFK